MKAQEIIGFRGDTAREVKVKTYDFKRPDKFSKEQVRVLQFMHEVFARLTTTSLSARLRTLVHVHVAAVDQLTYEEFIRSIPNPCTLAVVDMSPLRGRALLEIDPSIAGPMVDRALGGEGAWSGTPKAFTPVESVVVKGLLEPLLGNLREAWSTVVDLRPTLDSLESNPLFCGLVPPTEMVVLVSLEVKLFEVSGMVNLCIPFLCLESILHSLSYRFHYDRLRPQGDGAGPSPACLPVASEICCVGGELPLQELGGLRPGLEIALSAYSRGEFLLRAGGVDVASMRRSGKGRLGDDLVVGAPAQSDQRWMDRRSDTPSAGVAELREALASPLEEFGEGVRRSVEELRGQISALSERQDQLADQLLLSAPDDALRTEVPSLRPFSFITAEHGETLIGVLQGENLQGVSLILSFLDPPVVSHALATFEESEQVEIARRIARLGSAHPDVLSRVEEVVRTRFAQVGAASLLTGGGVDMVAEVLSTGSRSIERTVLGALEESDPELAEELKRRMLVFEDVVLLDPEAVRKVVAKAGTRSVAMALKGTSDQVANHIMDNLEKADREAVQADHQALGRVRLRDVEEAQQYIVGAIRELEDAGVIAIGPADAVVD